MRFFTLFWGTLLLILPQMVSAQAYKTETGHAEFKSEVPLHSFVGSSDHLVGKISLPDSTVDFYIDLTTLDTGNNKRDKDMRSTLDTDEYPFAEFFGKLVTEFNTENSGPQKVTVEGDFKIHGVSRNVSIDGTLQKTDKGLEVKASWTLDMTDYDIKPPGILFYRVDENIDIQIDALLEPLTEKNQ